MKLLEFYEAEEEEHVDFVSASLGGYISNLVVGIEDFIKCGPLSDCRWDRAYAALSWLYGTKILSCTHFREKKPQSPETALYHGTLTTSWWLEIWSL